MGLKGQWARLTKAWASSLLHDSHNHSSWPAIAVTSCVRSDGGAFVLFTSYQLLQRADKRQVGAPALGLTHNLGGVPYLGIAGISILGLHG